MRPGKYPLEPARRLRGDQAEAAARELAAKVRAEAAAAAEKAQREEARLEAEQAAARTRAAEREALERGELKAADLARQDAWGMAVQMEKRTLEGAVDTATRLVEEAKQAVCGARAALAERKAAAEVLVRDQARFEAAKAKAQEARDEEAAAEAWRPRRA